MMRLCRCCGRIRLRWQESYGVRGVRGAATAAPFAGWLLFCALRAAVLSLWLSFTWTRRPKFAPVLNTWASSLPLSRKSQPRSFTSFKTASGLPLFRWSDWKNSSFVSAFHLAAKAVESRIQTRMTFRNSDTGFASANLFARRVRFGYGECVISTRACPCTVGLLRRTRRCGKDPSPRVLRKRRRSTCPKALKLDV
mgnify:CR=1 FL=1